MFIQGLASVVVRLMWGSTLLQDQITDTFSAKRLEDSFRDW